VHEQEIRPTSVHTEEFLLVFLIDITVFVFSRHILRQNAWMLKLRLIKLKPKILPSSSNYGLVCCVKRFTSRGQSHEALLHCRLYWFTALYVGLWLLLKRMKVGHLPRPLSRTVTPPGTCSLGHTPLLYCWLFPPFQKALTFLFLSNSVKNKQ